METDRLGCIYDNLRKRLGDPAERFLVESVEAQQLFLCEVDGIIAQYDASTSRFGTGIRENSLKTPPGIHRISQKIGSGAPPGRIFRDRMDTGADWDGSSREDNLILSGY